MVLHTKHYSLRIDKKKCTGCGVCMEICPREAIQVTRTIKADGNKAKPPTVKISKEKCHYCGICESICPFGALHIKIDRKTVIPVNKTESFPQLKREIKVDDTKCGLECLEINDPCPLDLIKVSLCDTDEKVTDSASKPDKKKVKVKVIIEKESCPCCRLCKTKFPDGVIHVEKIFYGSLRIDNNKCPEGCHDCIDVCPIPGVLIPSNQGKVQVNESHCVYCGACKIACPEEEAIELNRTRIRHTEVRSGAWNKALEKLASTDAVIKEMANKSAQKLKKVIGKRFPPEELENNV